MLSGLPYSNRSSGCSSAAYAPNSLAPYLRLQALQQHLEIALKRQSVARVLFVGMICRVWKQVEEKRNARYPNLLHSRPYLESIKLMTRGAYIDVLFEPGGPKRYETRPRRSLACISCTVNCSGVEILGVASGRRAAGQRGGGIRINTGP